MIDLSKSIQIETETNFKDDNNLEGYMCPVCKNINSEDEKYCKKCGQWLLNDLTKPIFVKKTRKSYYIVSRGIFFVVSLIINKQLGFPLESVLIILLLSLISFIRIIISWFKQDKKAFFFAFDILIFVSIFFISIIITVPSNKFSNSNPSLMANSGGKIIENIIDYSKEKESCSSIPYNEFARNPDGFNGKKVFLSGQIIQIMENGKNLALRVNVNENNSHNNTIYVLYTLKEDEKRLLDSDQVNIWGVLKGIETYQTIFGSSVSIPRIEAFAIELIEKK